MNKVILIGNLANDPEARTTQSGISQSTFRVAVEGSIQNRSYDAQDGSKRYVTEIIADNIEALGGREEGGQPRPRDNGPTPPPANPAPSMNDFTEVDDDELPF